MYLGKVPILRLDETEGGKNNSVKRKPNRNLGLLAGWTSHKM
jgi:hypothetical protein